MAFSIDFGTGDFLAATADVLAVVLTEGGFEKQRPFAALDAALGGGLATHVENGQFRGRKDQVLEVPTLGRIPAARVVLVGAGPKRGFSGARLRQASAVAARAASS